MTNSSNTPKRTSTRVPTGAQPKRATTGVQRTSNGKPANGIPPWGATGVHATTKAGTSGGGSNGNGGGGSTGDEKEPLGWKGWVKRILLWLLIAILTLTIVGIVALIIVYARLEIPEPDDFAQAEASVFYYADGETEMARLGVADRESVAIEDLPEYVPQAFVAAEDRTFYTNSGINIPGMISALWDTVVHDNPRGGSSITQQYVERYYVGETTTSIPGKIKETLLALKIDSQQSKDEILENYMNTIYLGRGAYGIDAASREFYDKRAADLTIEEAAMLAGIVPAPSAWDPAVDHEKAEQRWNYVLDGMVDTEYLTQPERDEITEFPEPIDPSNEDTFGGTQGYILQAALAEVESDTGIDREAVESQGYSIVTTIIPEHQQAAEDAVAEMPEDHDENLQVGVVTVEADTGAITSMYGGADYIERQRNAVTQDVAQAGSTFKPFALIGGLERGIGLGTQYLGDNEMEFPGFEDPVRNFGGVSYGWVDLVQATRDSINTAYVGLSQDIGPQVVMDTAIRAGLPEDTLGLEANASNVLGTASPRAIDMASAYATMATGGESTEPYLVASLEDREGEVAYEREPELERVFEEDVMADTTYAMQQVIEGGSGITASSLGRPLAGKTGTSNDNRSAWFVAFAPQIVGAVAMYQVGEDGSTEQITPFGGYSEITGGSVPASIWTWMMEDILEDYPIEEFPPRANVGSSVTHSPTTSPSASTSPSPTPTPSPTETTEAPEPVPTETTEPPEPQPTETTDPPDPQPTPTPDTESGGGGGDGDGSTDAGGANPTPSPQPSNAVAAP